MIERKVSVAIVGSGEIGLFRAIIAKALPEFELICIVEKNPIMAKLVSKQLGVPYYTKYRAAAQKENFSAVILSTPEFTHFDLAMEILAGNKHIFCEKPLSTSFAHSMKMFSLAKDLAVVHQVGYTLRCHPTFAQTKAWLDANVLGEISYIKVTGHSSEAIQPETRADRKDREKRFGMFGSFAVHYIDLFLWFAGMPHELAVYAKRMYSTTLEDFIIAICRLETGAVGNLDFGWGHHGIEKNLIDICITGSLGTLRVDFDHIELYLEQPCHDLPRGTSIIYNSQLGMNVGFELGGKNLSPEMENFAQAILNNHPASPSWYDGCLVDSVVDAINRSIHEHHPVTLKPVEE